MALFLRGHFIQTLKQTLEIDEFVNIEQGRTKGGHRDLAFMLDLAYLSLRGIF